jgi:hypothetical protein
MTLTFSPGLAPRAVFTLQAGSPLILTVSKTLVGLSGPIEGSKPGSAVSSRSSAASKEVLAVDYAPGLEHVARRGAQSFGVPRHGIIMRSPHGGESEPAES